MARFADLGEFIVPVRDQPIAFFFSSVLIDFTARKTYLGMDLFRVSSE
jgi:hypothetical protein